MRERKTDLRHLHQVVTGKIKGRHSGATFAHCHDVVGLVMLEEKNILLVFDQERDQHDGMIVLRGVLAEFGLDLFRINPSVYTCSESIIRITTASSAGRMVRGMRDPAYVYFSRIGYNTELDFNP